MRKRPGRPIMALGMLLGLVATACYLPRADVDRSIESQILVAVYRCSAEVVAGEISNANDVPVVVTIMPRWQDATRETFHEVEIDPIEIPANSTVEWEARADGDIARPQFCETETLAIVEST